MQPSTAANIRLEEEEEDPSKPIIGIFDHFLPVATGLIVMLMMSYSFSMQHQSTT